MDARAGELELIGRDAELAATSAWFSLLADGPAGLLIEGDAGIGKTALWLKAAALASEGGARVLVSRPVEEELTLGYAGLGDLLQGVTEAHLSALAAPQANALAAALSLTLQPETVEPVLVARATVNLLRLLADEAPVVLAIDDVQWLDVPSARAVAFAMRRLADARVGAVFSVRSSHRDPTEMAAALTGRSSVVRLGGLSLDAVRRLLHDRGAADLPRRHLQELYERSGGNPFFALELARGGSLADALPPTLHGVVRRRLDEASTARSAVELLAVLGSAPVSAFPDAAALDAGVASGILVEHQGEIWFAHPLLARGAYEQIPPVRRRELHALAAAKATAVEVRARHRALATSGPDPEVAALLDDARSHARARGAPESAAEFAAQALRLTPPGDETTRARRTMDEAEDLLLAADQAAARTLADQVVSGPVRGAERVRALLLRAFTAERAESAVADLEAAVAEPHGDRLLGAGALAQLAWQRGAWLGDLQTATAEAERALIDASNLDDPQTQMAALTTAGLLRSLAGLPGADGLFERAIDLIGQVGTIAGDHTPRISFAHERWWRGDFEAAGRLIGEEQRVAEARGDDGLLVRLKIFGGELAMRRGLWDDAARLIDEALVDAPGYWRATALVLRAVLRARRGDDSARRDVGEVRRAMPEADPGLVAAADFAIGLLAYSAGRGDEAADLVAGLARPSGRTGSRSAEFAMLAPEVVAILVEAGRLEEGRAVADDLAARTVQLAPWSDAAAALCRGLVAHATGDLALALHELADARERFSTLETPWELAQTLYAEGSVQRRLGRRTVAADALDRALAIQVSLGANPAADRTRAELRRARPRPRRVDALTAAETGVAVLAAQGLTNREIAAQLFVTVTTVEAHLTRIYAKLGVRSRTELARSVSDGSITLEPQTH